MKNIYVVGPRASGKTTLGRMLAERLELDFADTDAIFVAAHGQVADYVEKHGWDSFRDAETEALESVSGKGIVVACGGGIVLRERNRELLADGIVLYLDVPADELARRLLVDPLEAQRPSLTGKSIVDEVREVLEQRRPLYEACSHVVLRAGALVAVAEEAEKAVRALRKG